MVDTRLDDPKLKLPECKDTLHVMKPIGKYEPYKQDAELKTFNPKDTDFIKKKYSPEPKSHAEIRDMNRTLTG